LPPLFRQPDHRYSSRRNPLKDFLVIQLESARRYDRIAEFFNSSLLEVAGEALERMKSDAGAMNRSAKVTKCVTLHEQFIERGPFQGSFLFMTRRRQGISSLNIRFIELEPAAAV
jgi:hypothetical protein